MALTQFGISQAPIGFIPECFAIRTLYICEKLQYFTNLTIGSPNAISVG